MLDELRLAGLLWLRTRAALLPTVAVLFLGLGVYAPPHGNPLWPSYALTAGVVGLFAAVLVVTICAAEPVGQRQLVLSVAGPDGARPRRAAAYAIPVMGLAVVAAVVPAALGVFRDAPTVADVVLALLVHVAIGVLGVALGVLLGAPIVRRPSVAVVILPAYVVAEIAVTPVAPFAGGALWVTSRLVADGGQTPGHLAGPLLATVAQAALLLALALRLAPRREDRTQGV